VRALGIELCPEGVEGALLGSVIGGRRSGGRGLERPMHALMPRILFRVARLDELGVNAAPEQPDTELGEPGEGAARKGRPLVGADALRQSALPEKPGEHGAHQDLRGLEERLTAEEVAAVVVGHRERVAVATIAGAKVPLEVDRPEGIGRGGDRGRAAGMGERPAAAAAQAPAGEPETGSTRRGPGGPRGPLAEEPEQLLRTPGGMALPGLHELLDHGGRRLAGRVMRPAGVRLEAGPSLAAIPGEDGVAGLPADAIAGTERGEEKTPSAKSRIKSRR
jgi:hypothetical protein